MTGKNDKDRVLLVNGENGAAQAEVLPSFDELTPRQIVIELDKYIVGQNAAKRAVSIALRNRVRRQKLSAEMAEEVLPKNILDRKSTRLNSSHIQKSRMPSSA